MKYLLILFSFISVSAAAQNYNDSTITIQTTQQGADYIGRYLSGSITGDKIWSNKNMPSALKPYLGSGNNPDSLITVTIKAEFVIGMLNQLLTGEAFITAAAFNKILNNSPSIVGYTGLATQIVSKKNGNSSDKMVATFIYDWYVSRTAAQLNSNAAYKAATRAWSNY